MALTTRGRSAPITRPIRDDVANVLTVGVAVVMVVAIGFALADPGVNRVFEGVVSALPLLLALGVAAPLLVAVARRPQRGVLLLVAFVPFAGLLQIAPWKPPYAEGWKEALALYTLIWALINTPKRKRVRHPFPDVVQPIGAYLVVGLVSAIVVGGARGLVGMKVDFFWLLLAIAAWRCPLNARDRDRLVSLLMLDAILTSLFGLAQQVIGDQRLVAWGYEYNSNVRFTGSFLRSFSSFATPFNFAFFLAFALLMVIPQCLEDPRRPRNTAFLVATPLVALALVFTFVRGAWLALGVGLLYLAMRRYRAVLLLAPFALLGLLVLPGSFSSSAFGSDSLQERQLGWSQNISKAVSRPLGNGIGTTGASGFKAEQVAKGNTTLVYEPDNQYFKVLYELGVFGLWFLVFTLVAILLESRRAERRSTGLEHALALGFTAHVLGAIAAAAVSTWLEIFPNDMYLWLMLTVVLTATREQELPSESD